MPLRLVVITLLLAASVHGSSVKEQSDSERCDGTESSLKASALLQVNSVKPGPAMIKEEESKKHKFDGDGAQDGIVDNADIAMAKNEKKVKVDVDAAQEEHADNAEKEIAKKEKNGKFDGDDAQAENEEAENEDNADLANGHDMDQATVENNETVYSEEKRRPKKMKRAKDELEFKADQKVGRGSAKSKSHGEKDQRYHAEEETLEHRRDAPMKSETKPGLEANKQEAKHINGRDARKESKEAAERDEIENDSEHDEGEGGSDEEWPKEVEDFAENNGEVANSGQEKLRSATKKWKVENDERESDEVENGEAEVEEDNGEEVESQSVLLSTGSSHGRDGKGKGDKGHSKGGTVNGNGKGSALLSDSSNHPGHGGSGHGRDGKGSRKSKNKGARKGKGQNGVGRGNGNDAL